MRYETSRPYSTMYQERIYGDDRSVSLPTAGTRNATEASLQSIRMPVFGMVHGEKQNAFAGIITSGAEYCELIASPAGNIVDYNWVSPVFVYNEQYWQPTGKASGFYAQQDEQNSVNLEVEYRFLSNESANYVGMANALREELLETNEEFTQTEAGDIGLKLDAFMAEPKKALIGKSLKVMTEIRDVTDWVKELQKEGIEELKVSLVGYEKDGKNGHSLSGYSLDKEVGTQKELSTLQNLLSGNLFLQSDVTTGYDHQMKTSQMKSGMNGATIEVTEDQPIYQTRVWANETLIEKVVANYIRKVPVAGIALEEFACELNGEYQRNSSMVRGEVLEKRLGMLESLQNAGYRISLEDPKYYALTAGAIDSVFNVPMNNSQFSYFTDTVPFLQIVLSGYVEMYSPYQNFSTDMTQDALKLIDYNMYPSYLLTEKSSTELANSNMSYLYSSQFEVWEQDITECYDMVNELLSQVKGATVEQRYVPVDGVSVTAYSNGVTIAVNYNNEDQVINGEKISGMSAVILSREG